MDFTGRFETLNQDFKFISNKVGLANSQLPFKNKAKSKHNLRKRIKKILQHPELLKHTNFSANKKSTLSMESKAIIEELYADDFKNFNYSINADA